MSVIPPIQPNISAGDAFFSRSWFKFTEGSKKSRINILNPNNDAQSVNKTSQKVEITAKSHYAIYARRVPTTGILKYIYKLLQKNKFIELQVDQETIALNINSLSKRLGFSAATLKKMATGSSVAFFQKMNERAKALEILRNDGLLDTQIKQNQDKDPDNYWIEQQTKKNKETLTHTEVEFLIASQADSQSSTEYRPQKIFSETVSPHIPTTPSLKISGKGDKNIDRIMSKPKSTDEYLMFAPTNFQLNCNEGEIPFHIGLGRFNGPVLHRYNNPESAPVLARIKVNNEMIARFPMLPTNKAFNQGYITIFGDVSPSPPKVTIHSDPDPLQFDICSVIMPDFPIPGGGDSVDVPVSIGLFSTDQEIIQQDKEIGTAMHIGKFVEQKYGWHDRNHIDQTSTFDIAESINIVAFTVAVCEPSTKNNFAFYNIVIPRGTATAHIQTLFDSAKDLTMLLENLRASKVPGCKEYADKLEFIFTGRDIVNEVAST